MTDSQTLLLLIALLYLSECFIWVRKQSVAFISRWGGAWRAASPTSSMGNAKGRALFVNPFPMLGGIFVTHLIPISISPIGICSSNLQTLPSVSRARQQSNRFLPFSNVTDCLADGVYLVINKERFAKCASPKQAKELSNRINVLAAASPSDREQLVRAHTAKHFAAEQAASTLAEAEVLIGPIRLICSLLFVFLFAATPILAITFGLLRLLIAVGAVLIVLAIQISIMFYRAHKRLYPDEKQKRIEGVVKMVLCPPVSIRATTELTRDLLSEYSPMVVATLIPGPNLTEFVRSFVLDLQYPLKHEASDSAAEETMRWATTEQLSASIEYLELNTFGPPTALLAPPERTGSSISYCPRCGCQFLISDGGCPDCPGVGLVTFPNQTEHAFEGSHD